MYIPGTCIERVGVYKPGRERDVGGRKDVGRRRDIGRGSDLGRSSALRVPHSFATHARVLVAAEWVLGFAHLPDCSPVPYGSSAVCLRFGSPMC